MMKQLQGEMSSELEGIEKIYKRGAGVKTMTPFCTSYTDTGLFGVYVVTPMHDKDGVHDVFHEIQEELVALTTGVPDEHLVAAKAQLKYITNSFQSDDPNLYLDGLSYTAKELSEALRLIYMYNVAEKVTKVSLQDNGITDDMIPLIMQIV